MTSQSRVSGCLKAIMMIHLFSLSFPLLMSLFLSVNLQHFQLDCAFLELVGHCGVRSGHHHHLLHPSALHCVGMG